MNSLRTQHSGAHRACHTLRPLGRAVILEHQAGWQVVAPGTMTRDTQTAAEIEGTATTMEVAGNQLTLLPDGPQVRPAHHPAHSQKGYLQHLGPPHPLGNHAG